MEELTSKVRSLSRGKLSRERAKEVQARAARTIGGTEPWNGQTVAPEAARAELNWPVARIDSWQEEVKGIERLIKEKLSQQRGSIFTEHSRSRMVGERRLLGGSGRCQKICTRREYRETSWFKFMAQPVR